MTVFDLDSAIGDLVSATSPLSVQTKAALFGACGTALLPLLGEVERVTSGRWSFPAAHASLIKIAEFAVGAASAGDHAEARRLLLESGPHGHELDSPWSTYAQDVLICIDAGLVASSVAGQSQFKSEWVYSALEPMVTSLSDRGYDVEFDPVDPGSTDLQREMDAAVGFLSDAIVDLSHFKSISSAKYVELAEGARVLLPPVVGG
jgi:hypothetical protein